MPNIRRSAILSGNQAVAEIAEGPIFWLDETLPDIVVIVNWDTGGFIDWSEASSVRLNIARLGGLTTITPTSTLVSSMDNSTDPITFSVASGDGAKFPASVAFFILIDDEILHVASRTVDSFVDAARAQEGTTIATHAINSPVELSLVGVATNVNEAKGEQRFVFAANIFNSPGQYIAQIVGTFSGKTQRTQRFLIEVLDSVPAP